MSHSYVDNGMRAFRRLLAVAAAVASVLSVWPAPAEASIKCTAHNYIVCDRTECCFVTCVICVDTVTGEVLGSDCESTDCFPKAV